MKFSLSFSCALAGTLIAPSHAATPRAYAELDRRTERACIAASGMRSATVGQVTRFSDRFGMDARSVTGIYPQAHMNGQSGTVLCLYNRSTRRAETQEIMAAATVPSVSPPIVDVLWRGMEINGESIGSSPVTLTLTSGGKAVGRSACNSYSANYTLNGTALRILPGIIGTRMACPPPRMAQEVLFRETLASVSMVMVENDGSLILQGPSGKSLRFERDMRRN